MSERRACRLLNLARSTRRYLFYESEPDSLAPKTFADAAGILLQKVGNEPVPYRGYFFQLLKSQGPDAQGGAMDYDVNGEMVGGFAVVGWPAEYGVSGVQTLIFNHRGIVYEKDLGPRTAQVARRMTCFNPDTTWKPVPGLAREFETGPLTCLDFLSQS
jgi:hypothetical protein